MSRLPLALALILAARALGAPAPDASRTAGAEGHAQAEPLGASAQDASRSAAQARAQQEALGAPAPHASRSAAKARAQQEPLGTPALDTSPSAGNARAPLGVLGTATPDASRSAANVRAQQKVLGTPAPDASASAAQARAQQEPLAAPAQNASRSAAQARAQQKALETPTPGASPSAANARAQQEPLAALAQDASPSAAQARAQQKTLGTPALDASPSAAQTPSQQEPLGTPALDASRSAAAQAHAHLETLARQQAVQRAELDALSQRIEALKAKRQRTAGAELDAALRRSQALSDALAVLARRIADARDAATRADAALLSAINGALEAEQGAWSSADRPGREKLIAQLRALRTEREAVRARLPEAALPALAPAGSDDPTALLERADALRDSEDKVRRQLAELDARIAEAKSERDLDRRMDELSGDESMFDEQDHQLRLTRSSDGALKVDGPGQPTTAFDSSAGSPSPTTASPGGGGSAPGTPPPPGGAGFDQFTAHASDHTLPLSQTSASAPSSDDLDSLERERTRLSSLAQSLEAQARAAEQQARAQP